MLVLGAMLATFVFGGSVGPDELEAFPQTQPSVEREEGRVGYASLDVAKYTDTCPRAHLSPQTAAL